MVNVNFAKSEHIDIIADFEKNNFFNEAYSLETLSEIMKDNYLLKNNDNIFEISNDDELIGYIIFHISEDFTDIYKIFIRDNDKNKGYGTMLVNKVVEMSKRYHSKKIMIEVRSKNQIAINFYKKNNFNQISIRNNYYSNPIDDALIFERSL